MSDSHFRRAIRAPVQQPAARNIDEIKYYYATVSVPGDFGNQADRRHLRAGGCVQSGDQPAGPDLATVHVPGLRPRPLERRSEEHTSELQSLMRISSAVFCLKKKK